jgi:hypothetical protein
MIKQLFLLIQVLGLFFYQLIFAGDITVTQKVPTTILPDSPATVEIFINKSDVNGFAKVQQIIPEGFTVEPLETKGATFSFKDNKVKFIWMSLPLQNEFTISYQLTPNATTVGDFTIGGKFSFISESERKNVEIPVASFTVIAQDPSVEEGEAETNEDEESLAIVDANAAVMPSDEALGDEVLTDLPEENMKKTVNCKRTIEKVSNGKFKVSIEVDKIGVEGFAKISETLPQGFIASEMDSKGGVFSFKRNEVKILWMEVPSEERYLVSYFIEATESLTNGDYEVIGEYFYLDNDISSSSDIDKMNFNYTAEELVAAEASIEIPTVNTESTPIEENLETAEEDSETAEDEPETIVAEQVLKTNEEAEAESSPIEKVTTTPNPEHGVTYKVQVGAGHKTIPSTYFKTKFKLKDKVSTLNHEGWIKYLVGSFDVYKLAKDKRDLVRKNVKTAFVTAYNSGTRITVQEALMISRQKWYK